jgi:hypothetical protein
MLDVFMSGEDRKPSHIARAKAAKQRMEEFLKKKGPTLVLVTKPKSAASPRFPRA